MSKIIPSPDWFVGLDSVNLCQNGHFVETVTIEVLKKSEIKSLNFDTQPRNNVRH